MPNPPHPITITGHSHDEDGVMRVDLELRIEVGETVGYTPDALRKLAKAMNAAADRADRADAAGEQA